MKDFGVIVVCTRADYIFAKGCCASIRYFMGDVPLCLLVDGEGFSLEGLPETYDAIVLKKRDIKSGFLRSKSFGWGITKMVAFWESPFKHFLLLDADTNVWGDVREHADYDRYDIIIDKPYYSCSEENINKFFFDTGQMKVHFPDFDYLKHQFVCTGVIFGRRDIFNIEEYKKMLNFVDKQPNLFKFGEMGFLNYMFFNSAEKGRIKLGSSNIQYIACDFDPEETEKRFYVKGNKPALDGGSTVIHWAGSKKPVAKNPFGYYPYREPMAFFRKKFLKDTTNMPSWQIRLVLWKEDKLREFLILKSRCHIKAVMFVKSIINKVKSLFS